MTTRQFFYLTIVAVALGFAGIIGAFYWGDQQLNLEADTISNLRSDRDIAKWKIVALNSVGQDNELRQEAEELLDALLPRTKNQETLVADVIYTASAEAGIPASNLTSLSFSSSSEPTSISGTLASSEVSGVLEYPFNLNIQDISYQALLDFLTEIENNGRLVQIDQLQISPDREAPGRISGVSLSMKAFLKP